MQPVRAPATSDKSPTRSSQEMYSWEENSIGEQRVNKRVQLLWLILLVKLVPGFGQQPASRFESLVASAQQAQAANDYAAAANDYAQAVKIRADIPELWANLGLMEQEVGDLQGATQ